MKLVFKEKYLSIEQFNEVDLPDFTVLTGVNGSGKTHLLKAIHDNKISIEQIDHHPKVIYFDYTTFKLENEVAVNEEQLRKERDSAWGYFEKNGIRSEISAPQLNMKLTNNKENISDICKENKKNIWQLTEKDIEDKNLLGTLIMYKKNIEALFSRPNIKNIAAAPILLNLIKEDIDFNLANITETEFKDRYKPFSLKNDFLPKQLGKILYDYHAKKEKNEINTIRNQRQQKNYTVLSKEEFIKKHGEDPVDIINTILQSFGQFDYKINFPENFSSDVSYQLKLLHKTKNIEIDFENLSSGEKTLMALIASIYQSTSRNHFPNILLLDEIDASLHPSMTKNLFEVINEIFLKKGIKVILATHSPSTVALAPEESIYVMNKEGENI